MAVILILKSLELSGSVTLNVLPGDRSASNPRADMGVRKEVTIEGSAMSLVKFLYI
jgi:hypothetical protein